MIELTTDAPTGGALGAAAPPRTGEKILTKYQKIIVCAV